MLLVLSSCAVPVPTPEELLSYETEPFTCGFLAQENGTEIRAALVRGLSGDTLTAEMPHSRVVFSFSGGCAYLCTAPSETEPALSVSVSLPEACGAAHWQSLFSLLPSDSMTVSRSGNGYRLSDSASGLTLFFSADGFPERSYAAIRS